MTSKPEHHAQNTSVTGRASAIAVVVDRTDARALERFREVMAPPVYEFALRIAEPLDARFLAVMLSPSGGFAIVPLCGVAGLTGLQRLIHDIAASFGNVHLLRDEFDPATESELASDLHEITGCALNECGHA